MPASELNARTEAEVIPLHADSIFICATIRFATRQIFRNVSETTSPIRNPKNSRQRGFETRIWKSTMCLSRLNQRVRWADDRSPTNSLESRNGGTRSSAHPTTRLGA
jgi:hypothetical protein